MKKIKKKIEKNIHRSDPEEPEPAVDPEPGDQEVREVTPGEHAEAASGDGGDHEPHPDLLARVIIVEVRDTVVSPGIAGHVTGRGRDKEADHDWGGEGLSDQVNVAGDLRPFKAHFSLIPLLTQLVTVAQLPYTRDS